MKTETKETVKQKVCYYSQQLIPDGLTIGTGGNISARIPDSERVAIKPSGIPYNTIRAEDIIIVDLNGNVVEGTHIPSSETPMHTMMYKEFPDIMAVVHTHSQYATAFSVIREPIPLVCNEGFGAGTTKVDVADYEIPGIKALGDSVLRTLSKKPGSLAVLLANHGLLALGKSLEAAYSLAQNIEWEAKIYYLARTMGHPFQLSEEQLEQVVKHYAALRSKK